MRAVVGVLAISLVQVVGGVHEVGWVVVIEQQVGEYLLALFCLIIA